MYVSGVLSMWKAWFIWVLLEQVYMFWVVERLAYLGGVQAVSYVLGDGKIGLFGCCSSRVICFG